MSTRNPWIRSVLITLVVLMALSCQLPALLAEPTPVIPTPTEIPSETPTIPPTYTHTPLPASATATAVVVVTFTATQVAVTTPVVTLTPFPTTPFVSPTAGPSPTPTFSPTPVVLATFTPTLNPYTNIAGLWYGTRVIKYKKGDCEESIFHNLRWRIEVDDNYYVVVNDDLFGWKNGNVVYVEGEEKFMGGTTNLEYLLTVGPTKYEMSGYLKGEARILGVCDQKGRTHVSVSKGPINIHR